MMCYDQDFIESQIASFSREFACEFELWIRSNEDGNVERTPSQWKRSLEFDSGNALSPDEVRQVLDHAAQSEESYYSEPGGDGQLWIVTTLQKTAEETWVAVGLSRLNALQLAARLSERMDASNADEETIRELREHLELFAEQMSHKLEELSWLRSLASRLEFSTAKNRMEDVAVATFETLRKTINAESLALVRMNNDTAGASSSPFETSIPVWIGEGDIEERLGGHERFTGFLECAARCATERSFVWNAGGVTDRIPRHIVPQGVRSCVLVRIRTSLHEYGWLLALNKNPCKSKFAAHGMSSLKTLGLDEFGTIEASLLEAAAGMLATHAANVQLFSDQQDLTVSVIRSLINVVDARDKYTCGHSDRVALMAKALARVSGLSAEEQKTIYLSGLLHDIGKVAVPDEILLKAGRLEPSEMAIIQQHSERGVEILKHIRQLESVLPGVLHHHEAVDGSGYPHGLRGEEIPLMGRLIAVVDAFDAMTTNRPYRDARSHAEAVDILKNGAGTQWDKELVSVFLSNLEEILADSNHWESHIAQLLTHDRANPAGAFDVGSSSSFQRVLTG